MEHIPRAKDIQTSYENFIARCPWCGGENIFNRASDLKDFQPIDYREVSCLNPDCSKPFYLNADVIDPAYQMLIFDCNELLQRKHYAYCILNLAQAFEVFFGQYLRVELLYKPYGSDPEEDIERLNDINKLLYDRTKQCSFERMRNLFFWIVLQPRHPASLHEAETIINGFPDKPSCPSDEAVTNASISADKRIRELLLRLKSCKIPELRNQVVHQRAYRPTLDEVNNAVKEAREILFVLPHALQVVNEDLNWYLGQRAKGLASV